MAQRLSKKEALESGYVEPPPDLQTATSFLQSPFKTPKKDAKGTSAHVNFYTAPYYIRISQELMGKVADFTTLSDVYACALHYGLKWIQEQEGVGTTSVQSQLNVWMGICQQAEMDEDIMLAMERMRETVNRKIAAGSVEEAKRTVALARHAAEQMPEGYYKNKALEFLVQEFGSLWGEENGKGEAGKSNGSGVMAVVGMGPMEVK